MQDTIGLVATEDRRLAPRRRAHVAGLAGALALVACACAVGVSSSSTDAAGGGDARTRYRSDAAVDAPTPAGDDAAAALDAVMPPPSDDAGAMPPGPDGGAPPGLLHEGRTYDQERGYIAWEGPVMHVTVQHRDNTSLPAEEGGGSCSATCTEAITRIGAGGRVWGRFVNLQSFSVQVASGGDADIGTAVIQVCDAPEIRVPLMAGTRLGFVNHPQPAFPVPDARECTWSIRAEGGWVPFRAVTVVQRTGPAPTVDVRVDGTDGPLVVNAPASYRVGWTSTNASSCTASEAWTGPRELRGETPFAGVGPGARTYRVTCTNGSGTATDAVQVVVNTPPG